MKERELCFPFGIPGGAEPTLFCFHHAGGNASQLRCWAGVNNGIAVVPVEYAGHGTRMREPYAESIAQIAKEIAKKIVLSGRKKVYLYGHSFGSLVAFETAKELEKNSFEVQKLIVAGRGAPFDSDLSGYRTSMSRDALIDQLRRLGGMEEEMLLDERFIEYFAPIILGDLKLIEQYLYDEQKINCPIVAHCSDNDPETNFDQMSHWKDVTHRHFTERLFIGNHFFVFEDETYFGELLKEID